MDAYAVLTDDAAPATTPLADAGDPNGALSSLTDDAALAIKGKFPAPALNSHSGGTPPPAAAAATVQGRPSGRPSFLDDGPSTKVRANPLSPAEAAALGSRAPAGPTKKYLVKARATVRQSPEDESNKVGDFQPGEIIECCDPIAGRVQAITAPQPTSKKAPPPAGGGWLKLQTATGKELLEEVLNLLHFVLNLVDFVPNLMDFY